MILLRIIALTAAAVASYYAVCAWLTDGNPTAAIVVAGLALVADIFIEDHQQQERARREWLAQFRDDVWERRNEEIER